MDAVASVPQDSWTTEHTILLPESGTYILPYALNESAGIEGRLWLDGGTWKGLKISTLVDGVITSWHELSDAREYASRVYENKHTGEYEIDCLGERDGSFCAPYNNTEHPGRPLANFENLTITSRVGPLPAGQHALVISSSFDRKFRLELLSTSPMWLGEPTPAGVEVRLGPEMFRGDYIDMKRCASIAWCGSVIEGRLNIDAAGQDLVFVDAYGLLPNTLPYFKLCLHNGTQELSCADRGSPGIQVSFMRLRSQVPAGPDVHLRLTVLDDPNAPAILASWHITGSVTTLKLPDGLLDGQDSG